MNPNANPDVEDSAVPELVLPEEPEAEQEVQAEETQEAEPTAAGAEEATSRRSRAVARGERQPRQAINLDESPEFRAYKAESDRKQAELAERLRAYEEQAEQQRELAQQAQLQQLSQTLDDEIDPTRRQALVEQMAAIRSQAYVRQWQTWSNYVSQQVTEAGLDPKAFDPMSYKTREAFERDLLQAKSKKLETELDTYRKTADPTALEKIVERRVAEALRQHGLDVVETAAPEAAGPPSAQEWQRDSHAVQMGQMSPQAYLKKWGNRSPT